MHIIIHGHDSQLDTFILPEPASPVSPAPHSLWRVSAVASQCVCLIHGGSFKEGRWLTPRFGRLTYLSSSCQLFTSNQVEISLEEIWKLSQPVGNLSARTSTTLLWTCWPASWMPHYLEAVTHQPTPFVSTHILKNT